MSFKYYFEKCSSSFDISNIVIRKSSLNLEIETVTYFEIEERATSDTTVEGIKIL